MSIKKNFINLFLVQVSNYIFPLITIPYLGRTLGVENFGKLMLLTAFMQYFVLITDYGFGLTATKKIAINSSDQTKINDIFSSVFYSKLLLMVFCFLILIILSFFFSSIPLNIFFMSFLTVIGNVLFPFWFFQGIEKVNHISYITIASRFITLIGTFFFVKTKSDFGYAVLFQSLNNLISGLLSVFYIKLLSLASLKKPDFKLIKIELYDGFSIFISTVATSFYTTLNTIILGVYVSPVVLGNFTAADKLRNALQSMIFPLHQVIYPRASKQIANGEDVINVLKKYGSYIIAQGIITSFLMYFFGSYFIKFYYGSNYSLASQYFVSLSLLPFIVSVAIVLGTLGLVAVGRNKLISKIYVLGAILHVAYSIPAIRYYGVNGLIFSVILTELIITFVMGYFVFYKPVNKIFK